MVYDILNQTDISDFQEHVATICHASPYHISLHYKSKFKSIKYCVLSRFSKQQKNLLYESLSPLLCVKTNLSLLHSELFWDLKPPSSLQAFKSALQKSKKEVAVNHRKSLLLLLKNLNKLNVQSNDEETKKLMQR